MLTVKIKEYTANGSVDLTLTNECRDNYNFVNLKIEGKEYEVSVDDLYSAIKAFKEQQGSQG